MDILTRFWRMILWRISCFLWSCSSNSLWSGDCLPYINIPTRLPLYLHQCILSWSLWKWSLETIFHYTCIISSRLFMFSLDIFLKSSLWRLSSTIPAWSRGGSSCSPWTCSPHPPFGGYLPLFPDETTIKSLLSLCFLINDSDCECLFEKNTVNVHCTHIVALKKVLFIAASLGAHKIAWSCCQQRKSCSKKRNI